MSAGITGWGCRAATTACSAGDNGGVGGDGEQAVTRIIVAMNGTRMTLSARARTPLQITNVSVKKPPCAIKGTDAS